MAGVLHTLVGTSSSGDHRAIEMLSKTFRYKIDISGDEVEIARFEKLCDGQKQVTVYTKQITPNEGDEEDYRWIKQMEYNGSKLWAFEDTNRVYKGSLIPVVLLLNTENG